MNKIVTSSRQTGTVSQALLITIVIAITVIAVTALIFLGKKSSVSTDAHAEEGHSESTHSKDTDEKEHQNTESDSKHEHAEGEHIGDEQTALTLTSKQMVEQGLKLATAEQGAIQQMTHVPAKVVTNTDQQAHVSPMFVGRVDAVYANLGQTVRKGQALVSITSPELVGQQSEIRLAQSNLQLAKQQFEREKQLWSQGISAKQDYQNAAHAYQQANIAVQVAQAKIAALGVTQGSNGRYTLSAPMSGMISSKDIMVGEYVQLADPLFVIDSMQQLWLEFVLPTHLSTSLTAQQEISFISLQNQQRYTAKIQQIGSQADLQTGRLIVRAIILSKVADLRPHLMVNVELPSGVTTQTLRVAKEAIQQIEGQDSVFVAESQADQIKFHPQAVTLGLTSTDQKWIEIKTGLRQGQRYVAAGSFLLKSELEKGEASHGH